ncbi:hypothetical protein ACFQZ2_00325 [Streptomonospora algeriensis]|uniref:Uncharacterized protein n=1 Tax=Streptomonospora algeriensis TaxID=995084 RepID=A0ABW3B8U0_9ACTN
MTGRQAQPLLEAIDARERALCREAEQARARIGELTTRLGELDEGRSRICRSPARPCSPWPKMAAPIR